MSLATTLWACDALLLGVLIGLLQLVWSGRRSRSNELRVQNLNEARVHLGSIAEPDQLVAAWSRLVMRLAGPRELIHSV
jgi:hypothetical protein